MTYEDFQLLLIEREIDTDPYLPFSLDSFYRYARTKPKDRSKLPEKEPILVQYWETGGASGGNCWNDNDPEEYSTGDSAPKTFADLDKVLAILAPSISYLQHRELSNAVIEEGNEIDYQYYGNYTDYAYQLIRVKRLHEELVKMGLISAT